MTADVGAVRRRRAHGSPRRGAGRPDRLWLSDGLGRLCLYRRVVVAGGGY